MSDFDSTLLEKHKGISGWLLLLCIILTFISPARTFYFLTTSFIESSEYFDQFPGLEIISDIDGFLSIALVILSIRAGIALWNIKPGAVRIAKNYLLIFLAYSIIASILPFMAGLPSESNNVMISEAVRGVIQSLFFFTVWYWYLSVSKRVKATYPTYFSPDDSQSKSAESENI